MNIRNIIIYSATSAHACIYNLFQPTKILFKDTILQ